MALGRIPIHYLWGLFPFSSQLFAQNSSSPHHLSLSAQTDGLSFGREHSNAHPPTLRTMHCLNEPKSTTMLSSPVSSHQRIEILRMESNGLCKSSLDHGFSKMKRPHRSQTIRWSLYHFKSILHKDWWDRSTINHRKAQYRGHPLASSFHLFVKAKLSMDWCRHGRKIFSNRSLLQTANNKIPRIFQAKVLNFRNSPWLPRKDYSFLPLILFNGILAKWRSCWAWSVYSKTMPSNILSICWTSLRNLPKIGSSRI